jgi:amidase
LAILEEAIEVLRNKGATIIDPVQLLCEETQWIGNIGLYEFKKALNDYLSMLPDEIPVHSLADVIAYNERHAEKALKYGQSTLIRSEATSGTLTEQAYLDSKQQIAEMARKHGIDYALQVHRLDALLFLGSEGGCDLAAKAGYPIITVPSGYAATGIITKGGYNTKGPQGISFVGTALSEGTLLSLAFGYEQATQHRIAPSMEGPCWDRVES